MTTEDKKRTLISYRMTQAKESLDEARYLLEGDKSLRSVANRIYYSMFYAVLALLVNEPYSSSKHYDHGKLLWKKHYTDYPLPSVRQRRMDIVDLASPFLRLVMRFGTLFF